jgi:hypothetical protein
MATMSLAIKSAKMQAMGDPGLFGSIGKFLGGVAKTATGIVGGLGIPVVSGVARTVGGLLSGQVQPAGGTFPISRAGTGRQLGLARGQVGRAAAIQRRFAGGVGVQRGPGIVSVPQMNGTQPLCPAGHRPNKTSYFLRDGSFVPAGSKCVKVRRRNPANMRAADRAIGRIESAKKAMSRMNRVTVRKKCNG